MALENIGTYNLYNNIITKNIFIYILAFNISILLSLYFKDIKLEKKYNNKLVYKKSII